MDLDAAVSAMNIAVMQPTANPRCRFRSSRNRSYAPMRMGGARVYASFTGAPIMYRRGSGYRNGATYSGVAAVDLVLSFQCHAVALLMVVKVLANFLKNRLLYAVLSSSCGSLNDISLGGQYPNRAAWAAVNVMINSLAIDLAARFRSSYWIWGKFQQHTMMYLEWKNPPGNHTCADSCMR